MSGFRVRYARGGGWLSPKTEDGQLTTGLRFVACQLVQPEAEAGDILEVVLISGQQPAGVL